jgi:hypothetical protein
MANPRNPDQKSQYEPDSEYGEDEDEYGYAYPYDDTPPPQGYGCEPLPKGPKPPHLEKPKRCEPGCDCPTKPSPPQTCFDKMIAKQDNIASRAERANQIKADLQALKDKADAAKQTYTRQKYEDFKKRWKCLDKAIVTAIGTVTCDPKCWWCVVECHICPELYRIRWIEERLYGDGTLMGDVHSLPDLEYWHERNVKTKQRAFDRIEAVLQAWKDPTTSIDAALTLNEQLVGNIRGLDQAEGLRTVLFEIVPRHLAIAPRDVDSPRDIDTAIEQKYIDLCSDCDPAPDPDDCCGPDVSLPSARQRLIPPQAFIVDPDRYMDVLCCLITQRYEPAQRQLENAKAIRDQIAADITALDQELKERLLNPLAKFKANIVLPIDCHKYNGNGGNGGCGDEPEYPRSRRKPEEQES